MFSKKPKLCQDAAAGYQFFNGLAENLDSFKQDMALEHVPLDNDTPPIGGNTTYGSSTDPTDAGDGMPGEHDTPFVSRGVAYVEANSTVLLGTVRLRMAAGCLQSMQIIDTGVYFFPITGFTKVWGKATPWHFELGDILADPPIGELVVEDARVQPATPQGAGTTGLIVKTFKLQGVGGNDILAPYHTGFYLVAYGRRFEQPAPPSRVAPLRVGNFGRRRPVWKRFTRRR
jgi:hypothetical protein